MGMCKCRVCTGVCIQNFVKAAESTAVRLREYPLREPELHTGSNYCVFCFIGQKHRRKYQSIFYVNYIWDFHFVNRQIFAEIIVYILLH